MENLTYRIMIWSNILSTAVTVIAFFIFITKELMKWI